MYVLAYVLRMHTLTVYRSCYTRGIQCSYAPSNRIARAEERAHESGVETILRF